MDILKIITFPEVLKTSVEISKTVTLAPYQWGNITLEKLILSRMISLEKRGIVWCDKEFAVLDLARIYAGYVDPRFLVGTKLYDFHKVLSKDWFEHYKIEFPDFKEWNHLCSTEKGILNNQMPDDVIEASKTLEETPDILLLKYQSLLT